MTDISIITLTYNSEKYLKECLDSIFLSLQQINTGITFEHIVCDGGSTDTTMNIVQEHPLQSVVLQSPVRGLYQSLDYAIKMANGRYISYVHSDDFVSKNFFALLLEPQNIVKKNYKNLSASEKIVCYCTDVAFVDSQSQVLWYRHQPKIIPLLQNHVNLLFHPNCLFQQNLELSFPYFNNNLNHHPNQTNLDWKHINTLITQNVQFQRVPSAYYYFRIHSKSTTVKKIKLLETPSSKYSIDYLKQISIIEWIARIYLYCHETHKLKRIFNRIFLKKHSWKV